MKLGLDIHKTLDADPEFFVKMAKMPGVSEVHILTGIRFTPEVEAELLGYGNGYRWWTHFMSITQYLIDSGHDYIVKGTGNDAHYHFEAVSWDKVKADYCKQYKIDLHVDDSTAYLQYFTTPYMLYNFDPTREIVRRKDKYKVGLDNAKQSSR